MTGQSGAITPKTGGALMPEIDTGPFGSVQRVTDIVGTLELTPEFRNFDYRFSARRNAATSSRTTV